MKNMSIVFLLSFSSLLPAQGISTWEVADILFELRALREEIRELGESINYVTNSQHYSYQDNSQAWCCTLNSNIGKGATKMEAKAMALAACKKSDDFTCREYKIKCEKSRY